MENTNPSGKESTSSLLDIGFNPFGAGEIWSPSCSEISSRVGYRDGDFSGMKR